MMAYWDAERRNVAADTAYLAWIDAGCNAVQGRHMRELIGERLYDETAAYVDEVLDGFPQLFEWRLSDADGAPLPMIVSYTPSVADGRVEGFFAVMSDLALSPDGAGAGRRAPRARATATVNGARPGRANPCLSLPQELKQVLDLIFEGRSDREIAKTTQLTEDTVRNYRSSLLSSRRVRDGS